MSALSITAACWRDMQHKHCIYCDSLKVEQTVLVIILSGVSALSIVTCWRDTTQALHLLPRLRNWVEQTVLNYIAINWVEHLHVGETYDTSTALTFTVTHWKWNIYIESGILKIGILKVAVYWNIESGIFVLCKFLCLWVCVVFMCSCMEERLCHRIFEWK